MSGETKAPGHTGGKGNRTAPPMAATSLQGSFPSPATLNTPGMRRAVTNSRARTTSSSSMNWTRGSNPATQGRMRRRRSWLMGVTMSVPSTLAKRRTVTPSRGLSSVKSRTSASTSTRDRSRRVRTGLGRGVSSRNHDGSYSDDP